MDDGQPWQLEADNEEDALSQVHFVIGPDIPDRVAQTLQDAIERVAREEEVERFRPRPMKFSAVRHMEERLLKRIKSLEDDNKELRRMVEALWDAPPNGPGFNAKLEEWENDAKKIKGEE